MPSSFTFTLGIRSVTILAPHAHGVCCCFFFILIWCSGQTTQTLLLLEVKVAVAAATATATAKGGTRADDGARAAPLEASDHRLAGLLAWLQQRL
jgi:hypothetical protein